jgi:hypothetical protein
VQDKRAHVRRLGAKGNPAGNDSRHTTLESQGHRTGFGRRRRYLAYGRSAFAVRGMEGSQCALKSAASMRRARDSRQVRSKPTTITGQLVRALPAHPAQLSFWLVSLRQSIPFKYGIIGTLSCLIRKFEGTKQWRRLADSTKKEYKRVFKFWDFEYGTCPYRALEDKAFRTDIIKWHDSFSETKPREAGKHYRA